MDICTYGNPVLRDEATMVSTITDDLKTLVSDMIKTMGESGGVGLAAQQVGHRESVCVIDVPQEDIDEDDGSAKVTYPLVLVNPKITAFSDKKISFEEGCLSFPRIYASVSRPREISLTYMDMDGNSHEMTTGGFLARVIQHEVDHLNGVVFIDRISHVKKIAIQGRLKKLIRETKEKMHCSL